MPKWIQSSLLWAPAVFVLLVSTTGWYAYRAVETATRDALRTSLETVLHSDTAALRQYYTGQRQLALALGRDPTLSAAAFDLAAVIRTAPDPAEALARHAAQSEIAAILSADADLLGFVGWGLFARDGTILAARDTALLGRHFPLAPELLDAVLSGETRVSHPVRAVGPGGAPVLGDRVVIQTTTPLRDETGRPFAVLGLGSDARAEFRRLLETGQLGESGETYAFDASGLMLSGSRFEADLARLGIIDAEGDAILEVEIRDPGGNRLEGHVPELPVRARPLTRMAAAAIAEGEGVDIDGYPDYRGVSVVGAWTWLPDLEIGLATEIDEAEAYQGLRRATRSAALLAGVVTLLVASMGVYALVLQRTERRFAQARKMGRYEIEEKIGEGGMGKVYRARHALLRRPTAVKVLDSGEATSEAIARFEREVQTIARLTHPNTIAVYDYGRTPEGSFYYAMEYLDGITLSRLVEADGAQPEARVRHLLLQAAGSLAEAHASKLIHRDVKPSNIMLCARGNVLDFVKVLDFGLVRGESDDVHLTATRALTGTPQYLSPEGLRDPASVDARSDIYQLGAVAYVLLTGRPVFQGDTVVELLTKHLHETPIPPSEAIGQPISIDLERIVLQCLAKSPADRPADGGALYAMLEACPVEGSWTQREALHWWEDWRRVHSEEFAASGSGSSLPSGWDIELGGRSLGR